MSLNKFIALQFQKDPRLELLPEHWFRQKAVLDIGCNVGFLTLSIAKEFSPNRILGGSNQTFIRLRRLDKAR
jgi:2-polyprenyl-3-methyl-5-hydroxy-6-metoxy-1,4-benzoquinol methylase